MSLQQIRERVIDLEMNLPNKLTVLRMLLVPVFVILMYVSKGAFRVLPLIVFVIAALTDAIDGKIARKYNLITDFGKFMDPLADKLLTASAFISFVEIGYMRAWIVILIISREFIISGFRTLAASKGVTIAANKWGKVKTVFQMVLIVVILLHYTGYMNFLGVYILPLLIMTVALTVISAVTYMRDNINVLS